jgi:hypothetical protein
MNFGKLLGAGKSFVNGRDGVSYRENKQFYLPKFNAEKNPFAPKAVEPVAAAAVEPKNAAKSLTAPVAAKTQQISPVPASKPVRATNWTEKLNPFRAPKAVAPPMMAAMQPELSLDAVKVVHNDLSDADVEVVPMKSRSTVPAMMSSPSAPMEFLAEPVFNRLTA